jgi:hypothetical protein
MKATINSFRSRHFRSILLLILFGGSVGRAAKVSIVASAPAQLALARYNASQGDSDAWTKSGPVGVLIQASLPRLYKQAALLAVRTQSGGLQPLRMEGDDTVSSEVIERLMGLRQPLDLLRLTSIEITPANYNFHLAGEAKAGSAAIYIYDITPRKKGPGLVEGQLWIDSATGREVMLSAHMLPTGADRVEFVRDTPLIDGSACGRVTHMTFEVPLLGRAEVSITEVDLTPTLLPQHQ